ncbi:MAG: sigma-70 family RNA polymerase sigma factor [Longimicrobiales bacterium]
MTDPEQTAVVGRLLDQLRAGDRQAFDQLVPLVYGELHHLAEQQRRRWSGDDTLNTTALVHEAYLRLAGQSTPAWRSRPHFLAVAARAMRHILLDYAKSKRRAKRGGGQHRVSLQEIESALKGADPADAGAEALLALEDALRRLDEHDPRQSRIVECRFFGGMAIQDTADALGISPATVKRGWAMAQSWLYRELAHPAGRTL